MASPSASTQLTYSIYAAIVLLIALLAYRLWSDSHPIVPPAPLTDIVYSTQNFNELAYWGKRPYAVVEDPDEAKTKIWCMRIDDTKQPLVYERSLTELFALSGHTPANFPISIDLLGSFYAPTYGRARLVVQVVRQGVAAPISPVEYEIYQLVGASHFDNWFTLTAPMKYPMTNLMQATDSLQVFLKWENPTQDLNNPTYADDLTIRVAPAQLIAAPPAQ